jgi:ankyrin repeat protein
MSTVVDIRIDKHEVCIMLDKLMIFRQLGYDFTQHNELGKIDPREVNIQDSVGNTALYVCVRLGHVKTAAALLFLGADVYLRNANGVNPISTLDTYKTHVSLSKNQESIQLLLQRSVTMTTITSALLCRIGKRSSLNILPIELIRMLDVMLFEPVTEFKPLSLHHNENNDEYEDDEDDSDGEEDEYDNNSYGDVVGLDWFQEDIDDEEGNNNDSTYINSFFFT